ncbi:MAG: 50S ribosomal protein L13 [Thaumarchaeota archaeon]|nr:50S ribosomal protein L13 [Nitrososphaerota archaeon]MCL5068808.1 50S ribosomal protein L13 [Nitrososphaerota archaeon]
MPKKVEAKTYYVDASGQIAGRLCSKVAKLLLQGNSVVVVHADRALFSGQRSNVMGAFFERLKIASVVHPRHGPFHPRTPEGILTRMVRGMIPRSKPSGAAAFKRLRVFGEVPKDLGKVTFTNFEDAKATKPIAYYVPLAEVAERIGWKGAGA